MWFRSLYWRIGLGFIALLAALLLVQALLVLWLSGPTGGWLPVRTPARLAAVVASELSAALTRNPKLPLGPYVREQFARVYQPFFIVMEDGRVVSSRESVPPPGLLRAARGRLRGSGRPLDGLPPPRVARAPEGAQPPEGMRPPGGARPPDGGRALAGSRLPGDGPPADFALIELAGKPVGVVAVATRGPQLLFTLRELGPTLALVGVGLVGLWIASKIHP
ncbi:MAG: hypothetical protein IMZ44_11875, partial [Planctomycetes bacterium]|nr:hypothetical protein [Planctomycetota bacterium]